MVVASPREKVLTSSSQTLRACFHFGNAINQEKNQVSVDLCMADDVKERHLSVLCRFDVR